MTGFLAALPQASPQPQMVFAFELKLLHELGLQPDLEESRLSPGAQQSIRMLAQADWPVILRLKLSTVQNLELRQFLHGFLIYHLGKLAKGREAALGVAR
jgi:hypothetical protein